MPSRVALIAVSIVGFASFAACSSSQHSNDGGSGGAGTTGGAGTSGGAGTTGAAGTSGLAGTTGRGGGDASCGSTGSGGVPGVGGRGIVSDCDGGCADGGTCFHATDEHSVCATVMPPQAVPDGGAGDTIFTNQCGYPGGDCPTGQECRRTRIALGAGAGAPLYLNRCGRDVCARNEDCPTGQVCQPPYDVPFGESTLNAFFTCVPAECRRNADCSCGRACKLEWVRADQSVNLYEGPVCR